jgi:hypothetical protein
MASDMMFRCLASLLAFAGVLSLARPASACSKPWLDSCRKLASVQQPLDDATDVPRNTELRVGYFSGVGASPQPVLETEDGQLVPTRWESGRRWDQETFVGRPEQLLSPSTHYRLRHRYRPCAALDAGTHTHCSAGALCSDENGEVISEFTTGAGTDEKVLAKPVLEAPLRETAYRCEPNNSCGPCRAEPECGFSMELPDLAAGLSYRVERDGKFILFVNGELSVSLGTDPSSGGAHGGGVYALSVVDTLGNRSEPVSLTVPSACTPGDAGTARADASVSITQDSGMQTSMADGGSAADPADVDGCSLGGAPANWTWMVWLALGLVRRRATKT